MTFYKVGNFGLHRICILSLGVKILLYNPINKGGSLSWLMQICVYFYILDIFFINSHTKAYFSWIF